LCAVAAIQPAIAGSAPVVVELFTLQGCSSCPPADEYLGELAARGDVIPLALHVDYWNYIGWTEPYASKLMTQRQKKLRPQPRAALRPHTGDGGERRPSRGLGSEATGSRS
jgi:hypothetical protein